MLTLWLEEKHLQYEAYMLCLFLTVSATLVCKTAIRICERDQGQVHVQEFDTKTALPGSPRCSLPALDVLAQILSKRRKVQRRRPFLGWPVNEMQKKGSVRRIRSLFKHN